MNSNVKLGDGWGWDNRGGTAAHFNCHMYLGQRRQRRRVYGEPD